MTADSKNFLRNFSFVSSVSSVFLYFCCNALRVKDKICRNQSDRLRALRSAHSRDRDRNFLDGIVSVAVTIPFSAFGLGTAAEVGGPRAQPRRAWSIDARDELPPLPAVPDAPADEARLLPPVAVNADFHAGNRRSARPRDAADRQRAAADFLIGRG